MNNKNIFLTRDKILKLITDRKRKEVVFSEKTLITILKGLIDKEYIEVNKGNKRVGVQDTYKLTDKKVNELTSFKITYFINLAVIWGRITPEELKCYIKMRYLHNKLVVDGKAHGNIFSITLEELAANLDVTKMRVSQMIENLYSNNILDRREVPLKEDMNRFYYEYKLNM